MSVKFQPKRLRQLYSNVVNVGIEGVHVGYCRPDLEMSPRRLCLVSMDISGGSVNRHLNNIN